MADETVTGKAGGLVKTFAKVAAVVAVGGLAVAGAAATFGVTLGAASATVATAPSLTAGAANNLLAPVIL